LLIAVLYFTKCTTGLSNLLHKISLVLAPSSQTLRQDTIFLYVNTKGFQTVLSQIDHSKCEAAELYRYQQNMTSVAD